MSECSKQPSSLGVGGLSVTPDVKSSVLMDITNSASSRSPRVVGKLPAVQHNQLPDALFSTGPTLLITSRDSPIPAHLANVDNTADDPWRSTTLAASLHSQMMTTRPPMMGAAVMAALTVRAAVAPSLVSILPHLGLVPTQTAQCLLSSLVMVLIFQMVQVHQ